MVFGPWHADRAAAGPERRIPAYRPPRARMRQVTGPLNGLHVVELAGLGPAPHAAMMLADLGAQVTRVSRPEPEPEWFAQEWVGADIDPALRGRDLLAAALKRLGFPLR